MLIKRGSGLLLWRSRKQEVPTRPDFSRDRVGTGSKKERTLARSVRGPLALSWAALFLLIATPVAESGPRMTPALQTPTPSATVFASQVIYMPLQKPDPTPQDVGGIVVDRAGAGMSGIPVKATAPGFEAVTTTVEGGVFHFILNVGNYAIQPINLPSQPASITVDGQRRIRVEFRERDRVVQPATPTPSPTSTPTPLPTPATQPTATATPTARPTDTPTPLPTLAIGSPVVTPLFLSPTATPATPRPTATPSAIGRSEPVNLTPWVYAFLAGTAFAVLAAAVALLVSLLRR
ncbi:MAG: hypothetical protein HYX92_20145 [Chloroflexi bacterium]|nr:hypothetical protein [Chloroflexota bacterium]